MFATLGGLKVGLVHARGCVLNEAGSITDLVIVDAVRKSDSRGEAMWKPSDDMSGGGRINSSVRGSHELVQKYRTIRKNAAKTEPETSRADASFMREGGHKVSVTIDSWVVQVSPVAGMCCVLAALVEPFSSLIARQKQEHGKQF